MDVTFWLSSVTRMAKMQSSGKARNQFSDILHNEAILYGTLWSPQAHTATIHGTDTLPHTYCARYNLTTFYPSHANSTLESDKPFSD